MEAPTMRPLALAPVLVTLAVACGSATNPRPANAPQQPRVTVAAAVHTVASAAATPTASPTAQTTPTAPPASAAILGEWVPAASSNVNGPYLSIKRIAFYDDGTTVVDDVLAANQSGRYSLGGDRLKLQNTGGKVGEYAVSFDNGTLVLNDGTVTARFVRKPR